MHLGFVRELPLLEKELVELAARRRTYAIRVLYVMLLFLPFIVQLEATRDFSQDDHLMRGTSPLGIGVELAATATILQLFGILVLLPAMVCGVISVEKERGSLVLLLVTDLDPWEIILQKLGGRLVPMFSLIILSIPLLAIAHAYGGITIPQLLRAVVMLLLVALQVGSFALLCSAYFRTTNAAFFGAYLGVALGALPQASWLTAWGNWTELSAGASLGTWGAYAKASQVSSLAVYLGSSLLFLGLARRALVARAFVKPRNRLLELFRGIDRFMHRLNLHLGGINVWKPRRLLPGTQPIAWREFTTKALGRMNYQVRVVLALESVVIIYGISQPYGQRGPVVSPISDGIYVFWGIAVAMVAVLGSGVIATERSRKTLDVLLTTPMTGRDIVLQKASVLRRYCHLLWIPFITLILFRLGDIHPDPRRYEVGIRSLVYFGFSLAAVALILRAVSWFAISVGLRVRQRVRALVTVFVVMVMWWGLPFVVLSAGRPLTDILEALPFSYGASPAWVIMRLERVVDWDTVMGSELAQVIFGMIFFWLVGALVRRDCLRNADSALGRC